MGKSKTSRKRSAQAAGLAPESGDQKRGEPEEEVAVAQVEVEVQEVQADEGPAPGQEGQEGQGERLAAAEALANKHAVDGKGQVRKVIILLDEATLEAIKTSKGSFELLNCDDHLGLHKKLNKDPAQSRPDIAHQMLLALLDSPLNKAGHLEVYLRTNKNVLIKVSEHLRIPRTFKRFAGLMVQLLHKMKIRAVDGNKTLLKVVKNPFTSHLPPGARVFTAEVSGTLVDVHEFVPALPDTEPVVFVFGAIAHGDINVDYAEAALSFSEYPLSGACAVSRLLSAFERKWGII